MLYSGTDPESYITEYTLVYEDYQIQTHEALQTALRGGVCSAVAVGKLLHGCSKLPHDCSKLLHDCSKLLRRFSKLLHGCSNLCRRRHGGACGPQHPRSESPALTLSGPVLHKSGPERPQKRWVWP